MSSQKISFGISKLTKKTNIIPTNNGTTIKKTVDYIDCLEGQSIKIKNAIEEVNKSLVIPMRETANNIIDRIEKKKNKIASDEVIDDRPDSDLTLDELAARQLLREAKNITTENDSSEILTLPNVDKFVAEGKEESTLDDYQAIPIEQFGMAMLRGMGWSEKRGIGKHEKIIKVVPPELRAKGMGLGADKIVNTVKQEKQLDKDGKELTLIKGAFAKIIAGKDKMNYCEVLGLDDESGRIIVKTALKGNILTLNEFLLVPVTKEEYNKSSKVINNAKYEEYKEKPKTDDDNIVKTEKENLTKNIKLEKFHEDDEEVRKDKKLKKSKKSKKDRKRSRSRSRHSASRSGNSGSKYDSKGSRHSRRDDSSDSDYEKKSTSKEKHSHSSRYHRKSSRNRSYSNSSTEEHYKYNKKR